VQAQTIGGSCSTGNKTKCDNVDKSKNGHCLVSRGQFES
jgi:hypothetical protein